MLDAIREALPVDVCDRIQCVIDQVRSPSTALHTQSSLAQSCSPVHALT